MAIIENAKYNSLPEQVEENKDNIKRINEILENIDPDQVATILSDIQALKAEQVVQNTAIGSNTQNIGNNTTAINNEKTERESVVGVNSAGNTYIKTATANKQILMYNNGLVSITSSNNNVDIVAPSGFARISTDNTSVMASEVTGVTLSTNESDVPNLVVLKPNGDFEVSNDHTLKFDSTGALTIDGTPVGGGGGSNYDVYEHHVTLQLSRTIGGITYNLRFNIYFISTDGNSVDKDFVRNWLYTNGYRGSIDTHWAGELTISGVCYECGIYSESNTHIRCRYWNGSSMSNDIVDNDIGVTYQYAHKIN